MKTLRTHRHTLGFTLIELLIVISIAVLLMLLTVPAFLDIGRGSKIQASVSQLNTTLNLARQWSITRRERVNVVFPDDFSNLYSGSDEVHKKKALRAYAVYVEGKGYVTEWRFLPAGVYFVDTYNTANLNNKNIYKTEISGANNVYRSVTFTNIPFPTATSSRKPINAIVFEPNGQTKVVDIAPYEIYISEAVPLDASGSKVIDLVWKENPVLRGISINKWTGSTRILDYAMRDELVNP